METRNGLQVETLTENETVIENENALQVRNQKECESEQMKQTIQQNDAAVGLIMLGHKGTDSLLDKYDNSTLLPVDATRHVDF